MLKNAFRSEKNNHREHRENVIVKRQEEREHREKRNKQPPARRAYAPEGEQSH